MIDKAKTILTILLILILAFAVIYSLVKIISSAFEKPVLLNSGKIAEYISDENLVTDYTTFYYAYDCIENLIEACKRGKYNELYKLYLEDYKVQYTEEEIISKLKEFSADSINYKLNYVYKVNDMYLADVEINDKQEYMLFSFDDSKEFDYYFAFFK